MGGMEMLGVAEERPLAQVYEIHLKQPKSETTLLLTQVQAVKLQSLLQRVQGDPWPLRAIPLPVGRIDAEFEDDGGDDGGSPAPS
jgi:hypothetical protein